MNKPFALVALGGLTWVVAGLWTGASLFDHYMLGLVGITVGFALAALTWGGSRALAVGSLAIALLGIVLFIGRNLFSFRILALVGSHTFALGLAVAIVALLLGSRARTALHRVALALGVLACAIWVVADLDAPEWQPGNVIVGAGLVWAAWRPTLPE